MILWKYIHIREEEIVVRERLLLTGTEKIQSSAIRHGRSEEIPHSV